MLKRLLHGGLWVVLVAGCSSDDAGAANTEAGVRDGSMPMVASIDGSVVDSSTLDSSMRGASDGSGSSDSAANAPAADGSSSNDDGGVSTGPICMTACAAGQHACDGRCFADDDPTGCGESCTDCTHFGFPNGTPTCTAGVCAVKSCATGWANCDNDGSNGCEATLLDGKNCGSCGTICGGSTPYCDHGSCVAACPFPLTLCGSGCRDLSSDQYSCGSCGTPCNGAVCQNGSCSQTACLTGAIACIAPVYGYLSCVSDSNTNLERCGGCNACTDPPSHGFALCEHGSCNFSCYFGYGKCGAACVDTANDASNCGACGNGCATGEVCSNSQCIGSATVKIVTGLSQVQDLALDDENIYWIERTTDGVWRANKSTPSTPVQLATGERSPSRIAVYDGTVYWSSQLGGAIRSASVAGGPVTTVASATSPTGIYVDGSGVYFRESGNVYRVVPPSMHRELVSQQRPEDSFTFSYCTNTGELIGTGDYLATFCTEYSNREGSAVYRKADGSVVINLGPAAAIGYTYGGALDERGYYSIYSSANGGPQLSRNTFAGGRELGRPLADNIRHMLSDGCNLFAATVDNQLVRYALSGGNYRSPVVLYTGSAPARIALDASYLYWADGDYIGRVAR